MKNARNTQNILAVIPSRKQPLDNPKRYERKFFAEVTEIIVS
jgi:hypothetical protein